MGWLEDIQRGWFGKRRDPDIHIVDNKDFVVPLPSDPAGAHSESPTQNYRVEVPPVEQVWQENDHYRSPDPTTHDAPQIHDQKETDNKLGVRLYTSAPTAKMETYSRSPDARWTPVTPARNPATQSSGRRIDPFDQGFKRRFDGRHFSMASMMRTYPVGGMLPAAIARRNTYRLDPLPSDLTNVDMPDQGRATVKDTQIISNEMPPPHGSTYRLG